MNAFRDIKPRYFIKRAGAALLATKSRLDLVFNNSHEWFQFLAEHINKSSDIAVVPCVEKSTIFQILYVSWKVRVSFFRYSKKWYAWVECFYQEKTVVLFDRSFLRF